MLEVVGHVVAAEGEHGHWVEAEFAHLAAGGRPKMNFYRIRSWFK
jgi:hypothetical protein